ncbi:hypothetical protein MKW92_023065 [Papaver armeniacum]|nr:hypothetical protein MKW92_023065 [Papaver armeniacum]
MQLLQHALCLGVVYPMSSGIGGGAFMVVLNAADSKAQAINSRETAPRAASKLHKAWSMYGKLDWSDLFQPAIKLARDGFVVSPFLGLGIIKSKKMIDSDPNGLGKGETCSNTKLADTLEIIANQGIDAFYQGDLGKDLVKDVDYRVNVTDVVTSDVMGFTILGMPVPSTGILGLSGMQSTLSLSPHGINIHTPLEMSNMGCCGYLQVLNILNDYGSLKFINTRLGLHRLIEALKHMLAYRMNLKNMLSTSFAADLRKKIKDDTALPLKDYLPKKKYGINDKATINHYFGAGVLSPSTGIILNNQMDDFSAPSEKYDELPPAPSNFIEPNKRPLSSMSPLIILNKKQQLVGVIGASGGINIIPAVTQVFLNHFITEMEPFSAVKQPRNWTVVTGEHIELSLENRSFLKGRNHKLSETAAGAICQLVVQKDGKLTAVSDPRKGGMPAGIEEKVNPNNRKINSGFHN